jgi:hypothetical protein
MDVLENCEALIDTLDNLFVDLGIAYDGGLNLVGETNQPQLMSKFGSV